MASGKARDLSCIILPPLVMSDLFPMSLSNDYTLSIMILMVWLFNHKMVLPVDLKKWDIFIVYTFTKGIIFHKPFKMMDIAYSVMTIRVK